MDQQEIRHARFKRVKAASHAGLAALTILQARRYLDECSGDETLDFFVWYWLGTALVVLCRYDEAEDALTIAVRLCPDDKQRYCLIKLGQLDEQRGDYERAAGWFQKAIEVAPRDNSAYIYLGGIRAKQGRHREAEEVCRTAIETCYEGCLDEAMLNLGLALLAQERFDEAAECFREAIRLDPGYRDARRALRDVERCIRMVKRRR